MKIRHRKFYGSNSQSLFGWSFRNVAGWGKKTGSDILAVRENELPPVKVNSIYFWWRQTGRTQLLGLCCGSDGNESVCNAGDPSLIPGLERSPGEGNGNPLQESCLENPTDRGAWWATAHGIARVRRDWVTNTTQPLALSNQEFQPLGEWVPQS